jgi:hypothetical protein
MSVIPFERKSKPKNAAPRRPGFWHRVGQAIDSLAAYPVKHVPSERRLRRADAEIVRCQKLMFPRAQQAAAAAPVRFPINRAVRTRAIKLRP